MDPLDTVASTAEAAFASDSQGRIVAWNSGAERVLGHSAPQVLGKTCFTVLQGKDLFGNRFCDESCPIRSMVHRHEPVHHFQLSLRTASSKRVRASVSVFVLSVRPSAKDYAIVHVLEVVKGRSKEPDPSNPTDADHDPKNDASVDAYHLGVKLTGRESEVLRMLAAGATTQEMARRLCISEATIRNHVHNILEKLNAHSRLQAVCIAIRRRLL